MSISSHPSLKDSHGSTRIFPAQIRIILLGESGTGKTSISNRVTTGEFKVIVGSTIGVAYRRIKFTTRDGLTTDLAIWDTAGQEKFRSLMPNYFRDADAAFFVFDLSDQRTFEQITYWLDCMPKMHPSALTCSVLIGNKADLVDERRVSFQEASALAQRYQLTYFETSAKDGIGLENPLEILVNRYVEHWEMTKPKPRSPPLPIQHPPTNTDDGSCC